MEFWGEFWLKILALDGAGTIIIFTLVISDTFCQIFGQINRKKWEVRQAMIKQKIEGQR